MTATIGVDVGGTTTHAVVRDENGSIRAESLVPTSLPGGPAIVETVLASISHLAREDCIGIGIGVPGQVDTSNGSVRLAVNLGVGEDGFPLGDEISSRVGLPVIVENDVRAATVGVFENLTLAGKAPGDLAYVSLGTGISAGLVIDGALHRGATGMAGEIGHVVVEAGGALCPCGQRGCLETVAAGPAIAAAWPSGDHASALFEAAAIGDVEAVLVADRVVGHLVTAIHWLAAAYDVDTIALGGGVASAGDAFLRMVRSHLVAAGTNSLLAARTLDPARVRLAPPDVNHGAVGAASLAAKAFDLALAIERNPNLGGEK